MFGPFEPAVVVPPDRPVATFLKFQGTDLMGTTRRRW